MYAILKSSTFVKTAKKYHFKICKQCTIIICTHKKVETSLFTVLVSLFIQEIFPII